MLWWDISNGQRSILLTPHPTPTLNICFLPKRDTINLPCVSSIAGWIQHAAQKPSQWWIQPPKEGEQCCQKWRKNEFWGGNFARAQFYVFCQRRQLFLVTGLHHINSMSGFKLSHLQQIWLVNINLGLCWNSPCRYYMRLDGKDEAEGDNFEWKCQLDPPHHGFIYTKVIATPHKTNRTEGLQLMPDKTNGKKRHQSWETKWKQNRDGQGIIHRAQGCPFACPASSGNGFYGQSKHRAASGYRDTSDKTGSPSTFSVTNSPLLREWMLNRH